jgi:hypothetical protein
MSELQRIKAGPMPGEQPGDVLVTFAAETGDVAEAVLCRIKQALMLVVDQDAKQWPTVDEWRAILPKWFVEKCADEIDREEAERRRSLPIEERKILADQWSVGAWTHWFKPAERSWYYWDARTVEKNRLVIEVAVDSLPFAMGSLKWLLKAAGANDVSEPTARP